MRCIKCRKPAVVHVKTIDACCGCFAGIIEKRIRKELRQKKLISRGDNILVIDDSSAEARSGIYLLQSAIKGLPVEISIRKSAFVLGKNLKGSFNKVIIPWSADREGEYFMGCVLGNRKPVHLGNFRHGKKTYIKLLLPLLDEEIQAYAKIRQLSSKKKEEKSLEKDLLDKLEQEYPEAKFSVLKSSREFLPKKNF